MNRDTTTRGRARLGVRPRAWKTVAAAFVLLVAVALVPALSARLDGGTPAAAAATVTPTYAAGNPSCADLNYDYGFKVDPPNAGTYSIDGFNTVTVATDGVYFDWSSTLGMDAVISKGGPNSNVYVYDPPSESKGDTGLRSPINPTNGNPYGLSHIEFCFDYELDVAKTANTSFKRTYGWTIDKSVAPATWNLFTGDSGQSQYTVAVQKDNGTDSDWAVAGSISIDNHTPFPATISSVADAVSGIGALSVDCSVTFPHVLASGASLSCSYSSPLPNATSRTNTATVTTSGGDVGGGSATAAVAFGAPTTVVNDSIDVDDSNGGSWQFGDDGSASYSKTFTCDADDGEHGNTATIRQTDQSDSASVDVNCYDLAVSKTAAPSLKRTYHWNIDKSADQSSLTLAVGQSFLVNYSVVVGLDGTTPFTDSDWAVGGTIAVHNPAPIAAVVNSVSDVVSGGLAMAVDCGVTFPYELAAGGTLNCTYSGSLPDASARTNTATATRQAYSYSYLLAATPAGTHDASGTANVDFSGASVQLVDEEIAVTDSFQGALGSATVGVGTLPRTFTYSRLIGPYQECGTYQVPNTASFLTNDLGLSEQDSWQVDVSVPCNTGCTLTIGYWKTHAGFTGNNADMVTPLLPIWLGTSGGSKSVQVTGASQAVSLLAMSGDASNGINKLYAQLLGAKLNIASGASDTAVASAISAADLFLASHNAGDWTGLSKTQQRQVLAWATALDGYNNGLTGPGHCSQ